MKRPRLILRITFLLLTVCALIYLGVKNDRDIQTIAEFKFAQLERLRADSVNAKHKFETLIKDTKQFTGKIAEESSLIKDGLLYLSAILTLWMTSELYFLFISNRSGNAT
jgi:hypothetical protein